MDAVRAGCQRDIGPLVEEYLGPVRRGQCHGCLRQSEQVPRGQVLLANLNTRNAAGDSRLDRPQQRRRPAQGAAVGDVVAQHFIRITLK